MDDCPFEHNFISGNVDIRGYNIWADAKTEELAKRSKVTEAMVLPSIPTIILEDSVFGSRDICYKESPMTVTVKPLDVLGINDKVFQKGLSASTEEHIKVIREEFAKSKRYSKPGNTNSEKQIGKSTL